MLRRLVFVVALAVASTSARHTWGGIISGPFFDYRGGVVVPQDPPLPDDIVIVANTGFDAKTKRYTDRLTITIDLANIIKVDYWAERLVRLAGVAYVTEDPADPAGNVRITTIYGEEQTPAAMTPLMTGFPAAGWDGTSVFSDERFFGSSGTAYFGNSLPFLAVADLPARFAGFDLSVFDGADPSSRLFAFETTMPAGDVPTVPEPSTLSLLGLGLSSLLSRRRR